MTDWIPQPGDIVDQGDLAETGRYLLLELLSVDREDYPYWYIFKAVWLTNTQYGTVREMNRLTQVHIMIHQWCLVARAEDNHVGA